MFNVFKPASQPAASVTEDAAPVESPVVGEEKPVESPRKPATPKWETDTKERIRGFLKKTSRHLEDLGVRDANEGDTRIFVTDLLSEALGYDKYADLTTEYQVRGEFADYGIRVDQQLVAMLEVKRVNQNLNEKHLRQVQSYALNEGVEWMFLTNGRVWQAWIVVPGLPVESHLVVNVDLLDENTPLADKVNALFLLSRPAMKRGIANDLKDSVAAMSPARLTQIILSDRIVGEVRREIYRQFKVSVPDDQVASAIADILQ